MGNVFKRSSGRAWTMRQRSMTLWRQWIELLNTKENPLKFHKRLIQIANSETEALSIRKLCADRKDLGLELLKSNRTTNILPNWPTNHYEGLISNEDGRIDPLQLQKCLLNALKQLKVDTVFHKVNKLNRITSTQTRQWSLDLANGEKLSSEIIVICASLGSNKLLESLSYSLPIMPVLGQVLELQLKGNNYDWSGWPSVLSYTGINVIPYGSNRILMGATLEPGIIESTKTLQDMKTMYGQAPSWIKEASIERHWSGLRGRPMNRPSPILQTLEPGLVIATGLYRNGILLAPATAEWVAMEIIKPMHN